MKLRTGDFVGREAQLTQISDLIREAAGGWGRVMLVHGEAGIGKTRLLEEVATWGEGQGLEVHWATCWEGEGAPAFWPWIQLIRSCIGDRDRVATAVELGVEGSEISRLVPAAAEHLTVEMGGIAEVSEQARFRLFDAVATFLKRAAAARPLMLIIDDLHWSDPSSLLLLDFMASGIRKSSLAVVAAYRDAQPAPSEAFAAVISGLSSGTVRIHLPGLDLGEVARLVTARGGEAEEAFVSALHERTDGNPLFVREFLDLLLEAGEGSADGLARRPLPEGVRTVLDRRAAFVPEGSRDLLRAASVLGIEFDSERLGLLAQIGPEQLAEALDQAAEAGVIAPPDEPTGRRCFTHALFRDLLYEEMSPLQRQKLHRRAGELIEEADRESFAELAHHFHRAGAAAVDKAASYCERAGARALQMLAYGEASDYLEQGLQALERARSRDDRRRLSLALRLGEAQLLAGRTDAGRGTFRKAADLARSLGDVEALAKAALGFGRPAQFAGIAGADAELIQLVEEALASLGADEKALRVHLLCLLAHELAYTDRERSGDLLEQALGLSSAMDDRSARLVVLQRLHDWKIAGGEPAERLSLADEVVALAEKLENDEASLKGRVSRMIDLVEMGELELARRERESFEHRVETSRLVAYHWYVDLWRAMQAILEGRLQQAQQLAQLASSSGERWGRIAADHFGVQRFALAWERGELEGLVPAIQARVETYPSVATYRCGLALAYAEAGKEALAAPEVSRLAADEAALIQRDYNWLASLALASEAAASAGDPADAATLYRLLLPHEHSFMWAGYATVCYGSAHRFLGALARRAGDFDSSERHLRQAIEANQRSGATGACARSRYDYALLLKLRGAKGDLERAGALSVQALDEARDLGLVALEAKITRLLGPPSERGANVFRREGGFWTLAFGGRQVRLKDSKGLRDLALLLSDPSKEFHVFELIGASLGETPPVALRSEAGGDPLIDTEARKRYRDRLEELQDRIDEAESLGDAGAIADARAEMEFIAAHLASSLGLGGRARKAADPAERARKAVGERIRNAIKRIEAEHPELAGHLSNSVRTGSFCSYRPEKPTAWQL